MFSASSSSPKVDFKRSYAAAVDGAASSPKTGRAVSRVTVAVGAVVAVGVSVLVGRSLLLSSAERPRDSHSDSGNAALTSAPPATASPPSWWQQLLRALPLHRAAAEDDDDVFASGTGAANLFDEAKTKARQLSKVKAKPPPRQSLSTAAAARTSAKVPTTSDAKAAAAPTAAEATADIAEREQHIKLVRALLHRKLGIEYDDDDDESSTDSEATDVSLNYHLASSMEVEARDKLLSAFADYEDLSEGAIYGGGLSDEEVDIAKAMEEDILVKMLEYLDMSNEREKLRHRRTAMYREQGRATPASSIDAADADRDMYGEDEEEEDDEDPLHAMYRQLAARYGGQRGFPGINDDGDDEAAMADEDKDDDFPSGAGRQARQFHAMFASTMMGMEPQSKGAETGDSVLDRILGQASASAGSEPKRAMMGAAHADEDGDMMEDGWEDEDDEEEADFMAYLQQPDDAAHFYSRAEMRQARRDPGGDVRVIGSHGAVFGLHDDDAEDGEEAEWEDEDGAAAEEEDEEDMMMPAEPWSRRDKADFERELFARVHQLANNFALTAAMAEREVVEEDERKRVEREQRLQQRKAKAAQPSATAATETPAQSLTPVAEDDEEWEDDSEWEDMDDGAE